MTAHPELELIVVCVSVPGHRDLAHGWPAGRKGCALRVHGATSAEAEAMAGLARQRSLPTIVGLQAHSDARDLFDAIERFSATGRSGWTRPKPGVAPPAHRSRRRHATNSDRALLGRNPPAQAPGSHGAAAGSG
jgi:predicted dehydrogenase